MDCVFDIETNGRLDELDTVHSLVIHRDGELLSFSGATIPEGIEILVGASRLIGHNILGFDLPALLKVYNFKWDGDVFDTLNMSRLIYSDMKGHALSDWGERLGITKGDFKGPWDEWTPEMQRYCEQDVRVSVALYDKLKGKAPKRAMEIEHEFQKIITIQEANGVLFDTKGAREIAQRVGEDLSETRKDLMSILPPAIKRGPVFTPKKDSKRLGYKRGCAMSKLSFSPPNPGSRSQIIDFFKRKYRWEPDVFTDKGNPKVDDEVLNGLDYPEARRLASYFERIKVLGFIQDGKNAWLKLVKNGRLYGHVITNGTVTGRCSHSKPNLAQVPSAKSYMGKECRALFHAGRGYMIGADASGLELRMLASYLARYDGGVYARQILEGDIHTANQQAAGLESRDQAKTFIYAYCYGAGDVKLGSIVTGTKDEHENRRIGKELRASFLSKVKGLRDLIFDVRAVSETRGHLKGLDGRSLPVRSPHQALNTLLQSAGAIVMKQANINFWQKEWDDVLQVLNIHDEVQFTTNTEARAEEVGQYMVDSITKAGEDFNLKIPLTGEYNVGRTWKDTH